jgi:hypothetical protein
MFGERIASGEELRECREGETLELRVLAKFFRHSSMGRAECRVEWTLNRLVLSLWKSFRKVSIGASEREQRARRRYT